jgi:4-hydroxy-4-methyl-2-oxoglutarate aldolase
VIRLPDWLTSTLASDAIGGEGAMDGPLPIRSGNLELQEVLRRGPDPGTVLVIGATGPSTRAALGGLVALSMASRGFEALIVDGRIRDVAEVREIGGIQVWCRGFSPVAPGKEGGGRIGGEVTCAGVKVSPGDVVVADDDGVVVWPEARVQELLTKARARMEMDREREAEIRAGGELV